MAANTRRRQIGGIGTAARVVLGIAFLLLGVTGGSVSVMHGQVGIGFEPIWVVLGLVGFPAVVLALQWLRARVAPTRLDATGPGSTALNMLVLAALLLTPWYAPPLAFTSVAALVFYGASMLLAALRGYSGCEVTAISNWILGRDDQVGCLVLSPVDDLERRLRGSSAAGPSDVARTKTAGPRHTSLSAAAAMNHVICSGCGSDRPDELASGGAPTPCPVCGGTGITIQLSAVSEGVASFSGSLTMALRPSEPTRGWQHRWQLIQDDLARQLSLRTEPLSADSIGQARHELHSLFVQAYHLKDALISETGIPAKKIENAITNEPDLALVADLANLDKHGRLDKPPRSRDVPRVVDVQGVTGSGVTGWSLKLTIEHKGNQRDGLEIAQSAIASWHKVLSGWKLI